MVREFYWDRVGVSLERELSIIADTIEEQSQKLKDEGDLDWSQFQISIERYHEDPYTIRVHGRIQMNDK